jgi:redox-sensitive bicupin YhaK (pirin superfamily)
MSILETFRLGFPWQTVDPFLFSVHHDDAYPAGNDDLGPAASLAGRELGMDFAGKDGWRMYHGDRVPGFPGHPHRGFETVTIVRRGLIDHSDSLGAAARFGGGDVQWLTAGKGIVHSEMFPLLDRGAPNPLELFQIWLNLPKADKLVEPHFAMLWSHAIPVHREPGVEVTVIAGELGDAKPPPPPPRSWAARADSDVAIWSLRFEPGASWTLPPAKPGTNRTLYVFKNGLRVADRSIAQGTGVRLQPDVAVSLAATQHAEALLLQGRPIGEPVVQHGPFVMNTRAEIQQAFVDYQRTRFGGWPWPDDAPVHPRDEGRFARHADGKVERVDR